jgi:perosamine synthetase
MIGIYEPNINPYIKSAIDALNSGWISNYGKYIQLSSDKLKEICNVKYSILMSNGTVATESLLLSIKFKHPEVTDIYISDHLFISPYNCILRHFNKENIHILPVNKDTMNLEISEEILNIIKPNSCVFIVHNLGGITNVEELSRKRKDLIIIEDNCEGFLGEYEGKQTGSSKNTLCSAISFYANKNITSGEGGAYLTNDKELYDYISKVYSHGMTSTRYIHDTNAWNFRMTNVQAALLYEQLCDINTIVNYKKNIFDTYNTLIDPHKNKILKLKIDSNCKSSCWMYVVKVITSKTYNQVEKEIKELGVEIRPMFYSVINHPHLQGIDIEHIKKIEDNIIMLPSSPLITLEEQKKVISCLIQVI